MGDNTGTAQPGERCESPRDCAPSTDGYVNCEMDFSADGFPSYCQVKLRGKEGDPCSESVAFDETGRMGTREGDATASDPSVTYCSSRDELYCFAADGTAPPVCAVIGEVASPCSVDLACRLDQGLYCDPQEQVCAALPSLGETCDGRCALGLYCPQQGAKACQAKKADGETCVDSEECLADQCNEGACGLGSSGSDLGLALLCGGG